MKLKLLGLTALSLVTVVLAGLAAETHADGPPRQGDMAEFIPQDVPAPEPPVQFGDGRGNTLSFDDLRGKLVLVNLWATWCQPCVKELPSLVQLKQARSNADFAVVTISEDRGGSNLVDPFLQSHGWSGLSAYVDPSGSISQALGLRGIPTTLLLSRDGRELGRLEGGADWAGADAQALLDWYLAHPTPDSAKPAEPIIRRAAAN